MPRTILWRTNCLHLIDVLRNHDLCEMHLLLEISSMCLHYYYMFIVWASVVGNLIDSSSCTVYQQVLRELYNVINVILELIHSEQFLS